MMIKKQTNQTLHIREEQIDLLGRLSNACGVSGDEREVRRIVLDEIRPYADEISVDTMGNVLAIRRGQGSKRMRVMLAAHMDEVGFMLTHDEGKGIYRFAPVGGVNNHFIAGKPILVGHNHIPGIIGVNPIHLTNKKVQKRPIPLDDLRIDLGLDNSHNIKIGARGAFATRFRKQDNSLFGKALDDRLGVASLIELLKYPPANIDLLAAFTVQEEVGVRGASVAAYQCQPDMAIVLDSTPARDIPGDSDQESKSYNTHLDAGPAIYISDRGTISDPRLIRHIISTAEDEGLPYQIRQPGGGGTDAGGIHKQKGGIPSISVSVPGRYLHTPISIARISDWESTLRLVYSSLLCLHGDILASPR
jgi:endoglucanase